VISVANIKKAVIVHKDVLCMQHTRRLLVSLLGKGENNCNYLVSDGKQRFVFRIALKEHIERNMSREVRMIKKIPKGIGPQALVFDKSKKLVPFVFAILSFIPGKKIMYWSRKHTSAIAKTLAELHKKTFSNKAGILQRKSFLTLYDSHIRWLEKNHKIELEEQVVKVIWLKLKKKVLAQHSLILPELHLLLFKMI
jgi:Ser/Thr protein kinase RdoA (MazF antagonist)